MSALSSPGFAHSAAQALPHALENADEFDADEVRQRMEALRASMTGDEKGELLFLLDEGVHGNIAGVGNPALYGRAEAGTKHLVGDYFSAVVEALDTVAAASEREAASRRSWISSSAPRCATVVRR